MNWMKKTKWHYYDLHDTSRTLCGMNHEGLNVTPNIENITCLRCLETIKDKVALARKRVANAKHSQ